MGLYILCQTYGLKGVKFCHSNYIQGVVYSMGFLTVYVVIHGTGNLFSILGQSLETLRMLSWHN